MDADGDHKVTWEEMQRLLTTFNIDVNSPTLRSLFLCADADGDEGIDYQGRCCCCVVLVFFHAHF